MANKVIIDVEARLIDRVSGQTSPIRKGIDGITDSAKKAKDELDKLGKTKVEPQVDVNENRIRKITEKIRRWLDKIDKSKATAVLDAHDKATSKIGKLAAKAKKFATQKFRTVLDAVDKASDVIGKVTSKAKDYTRRAFRAVFGADTREAVERISALGGMIKNVTGRAWHITMALKDQVTAPLRRILGMVNSVAGLAGAGLSAYGLVINPVQKQVAYENLETQFKVLLGSQEAAQKRIDELTSFASQTPFTRDEIYQASKVLETYTQGKLSRPDAVGGLRQIGDIAAGTGSDYTSVANTMGQMYVNMAAGNGIGDSLMSLRMMGALSADAQARIESLAAAVEEGSMDIDEAWSKVSKEFGRFDGMMLEMSNKLGNLLLGVKSMVDNNFTKKIGQGLSESLTPFLNDFRTWRSENSDKIAAFGERVKQIAADVSGFVLGKIRDIAKSISEVVGTQEFKNASLGGKIKILWDEVIAEPFSEWWSGKGRTWLTDRAHDIGKMLGDGITTFFEVLGGSGSGIAGGAASVGARFAKGFLEGFDLGSVAKNIVKAIVDAFQESPLAGLLMTGFIANKLNIDGLISGAQNVFSFFTEGLGKKILGSAPGNKVAEDGTIIASSGSGLLKFGNWLGTKLGASGKGVGIKGLSAAAGGVIGGITLASGGYDIYSAATADNEYDRVHKSNTAGSKIAGVGAGAAAGAAIGSIIPGLGTAIGALIGAGIGGIGGWLGGDWLGKNAAKNAMSLKDAAKVSETAAEEFQKLKEEQMELGEVDLAKHFGEIRLSTQEMSAMINQAFDPKTTANINKVVQALNDADASLDDMQSAGRALEKNVWLARMKKDAKLTTDEIESLKQSTQAYVDATKTYLQDSQYATRSAIQDLMGDSPYTESMLKSTDDYFNGLQSELTEQTAKLNQVLNDALSDGVITIDEEKSIANVLNAIDQIQLKINEHKYKSEVEALKAQYGGAGMTPDSFRSLMDGMKAASDERVEGRWKEYGAIAATEGITEEEKNAAAEKAMAYISADRMAQYDMGISQIRERYEKELGILGQDIPTLLKENSIDKIVEAAAGMDGDTRAAMAQFADILAPTKTDLEEVKARYESLGIEVPAAVQSALDQIELMELLRDWEETNDPETELQKWLQGKKFDLKFNPDIEVDSEAKDLGAVISNKLGTNLEFEVDANGLINIKTEKRLGESEQQILEWYEQQFNTQFEVDAEGNIRVRPQLEVVNQPGTTVGGWNPINEWESLIGGDLTFHTDAEGRVRVATTAELSENNESILNQIQSILDKGHYNTTANGTISFILGKTSVSVEQPTKADIPESNLEKEGNVSWQFFKKIGRISYPTAADIPDVNPISKVVSVIWTPIKKVLTGGDDGNGFRGGMVTPNGMLQGFSQGGYVHGGAQRIVVAEEGDPEVIIPLSPRRRDRAEKLWRETGKLIHADFGEKRYATGGFVGANEGGSGYTVNRESANAAGGVSGGQVITVNVGGIDINVHVKDGQNVLEAIREQKEAIAEEVASVINEKLAEQFQNMTEKKGA